MTAGDASTLRQVSLAALIGLDARVLLSTDDPAVHTVYDRIIEQGREWWLQRAEIYRHNQAVAIVNMLVESFGKKK
jgi:hypothetical protein